LFLEKKEKKMDITGFLKGTNFSLLKMSLCQKQRKSIPGFLFRKSNIYIMSDLKYSKQSFMVKCR